VARLDPQTRTITCKLAYCGASRSGKTHNLLRVHRKAPASQRAELTEVGSFEFTRLRLGRLGGVEVRFCVYTVPSPDRDPADAASRILDEVDGVIFAADAAAERLAANEEAWRDLEERLAGQGTDPAALPFVVQWNRLDQPTALPAPRLEERLNPHGHRAVEAGGDAGVLAAFKALAEQVLERVAREHGLRPSDEDTRRVKRPADLATPPAEPAQTAERRFEVVGTRPRARRLQRVRYAVLSAVLAALLPVLTGSGHPPATSTPEPAEVEVAAVTAE